MNFLLIIGLALIVGALYGSIIGWKAFTIGLGVVFIVAYWKGNFGKKK